MPRKVRYKVVKRRNRTSALVNGNSRYALRYPKGEDVFALEDTLGVFVFTNREYAESWLFNFDIHHENDELIIVRVIPIGKGKFPRNIAYGVMTETLEEFYEDYSSAAFFNTPPDKTICYPGVHVLD